MPVFRLFSNTWYISDFGIIFTDKKQRIAAQRFGSVLAALRDGH